MGIRIEKTELPGIGTRHDVITSRGRRIGVLAFRTGERQIAFYDEGDPDACTDSIVMSDNEATALADLLGTSLILGELTGIGETETGLFTEQLVLPAGSPLAGGTLGDTKARSKTGTSIVAIVHDGDVVPSPRPDSPLAAGDTIIAVGTRSGLEALSDVLAHGTD
jgi:TrkA domain protein